MDLFHIPKEILQSLQLTPQFNKLLLAKTNVAEVSSGSVEIQSSIPVCHTCGGIQFDTTEALRVHYRTEWHQQNMERKRTYAGESQEKYPWRPTDELGNTTEAQIVEEELPPVYYPIGGKDSGRLWFTDAGSRAYGVHRRILVTKKTHGIHTDGDQAMEELCRMQLPQRKPLTMAEQKEAAAAAAAAAAKQQTSDSMWTLLAVQGGYFAGCVFDNHTGRILAHRRLARYTTRRKQGGSQSKMDGVAKSAGSQIRSYNEQKLKEEIREVLEKWQELINSSQRVFVRVPKQYQKELFGDKQWEVRNVPLPVPVGRPSIEELKRVYQELIKVECITVDWEEIKEKKTAVIEDTEESDEPESDCTLEPEPRPDLIQFLNQVAEMIKRQATSDLQIIEHLNQHMVVLLDALSDPAVSLRYLSSPRTPTLLHLAAQHGRTLLIPFLLDHGEDPTVTSGHPPMYSGGQTAYELSNNRETREAFRIYRGDNPDDLEWNRARVSDPMTRQQQKQAQEKMKAKREQRKKKEKQKRQEQQQKEKAKEESDDKVLATVAKGTRLGKMSEEELKQRMLSMAIESAGKQWEVPKKPSREEQRAIDRELRARAYEKRLAEKCSHCGKPLQGVVPFEQYDWKCCSLECLHHQQALYGV